MSPRRQAGITPATPPSPSPLFADGLRDVRDTGRQPDDPELAAALITHGLIMGSDADAGGYVLTDAGRSALTKERTDEEIQLFCAR